MPIPYIEFGKFDGINNISNPIELAPSELTIATNVDIDNRKRICRRRGYTSLLTGNIHSLWSNGDICLFVENSQLKMLHEDFESSTVLMSLSNNNSVSYVFINDLIYFTNGIDIGYIKNFTAYKLPPTTKKFKTTMQAGYMIEYFNGRIYTTTVGITLLRAVSDGLFIAGEGTVWYSDPMDFNVMDTRRNFFSVSGNNTYFVQGREPSEFTLIRKADYGVIPYTAVKIESSLMGFSPAFPIPANVVMWASEKGVCVGYDGGVFINLTMNRYRMPPSLRGASLYRVVSNGIAQFITVLQNRGG